MEGNILNIERYYKLVDGNLQVAPTNLSIDGETVVYPTEEQYLSQGWKKLIISPRPMVTQYTKVSVIYTENETTITQTWEITPIGDIELIKRMKLEEIRLYDISSGVNEFNINGMTMWLPKNDRAALMNSFISEESLGITSTSIYTNEIPSYKLEMSIQTAKAFLQALEVYAKQCYGVTKEHQNAVINLTDAQDIIDYDFTVNYPTKLSFTL